MQISDSQFTDALFAWFGTTEWGRTYSVVGKDGKSVGIAVNPQQIR